MEFSVLAEAYEKLEATRGRLEMMAILSELFKKAKPDEIDKIIYLSQGVVAPPFEGIEVGLGEKFVGRQYRLQLVIQEIRWRRVTEKLEIWERLPRSFYHRRSRCPSSPILFLFRRCLTTS